MHEIQISGTCPVLVRDIGFTSTSSGWVHPDRILDYHVMIFVCCGQMQVLEDDIEYHIGPGDILFLKKGIHHWGTLEAAPGTKTIWVHFFDPSTLSMPKEEYRFFPENQVFSPKSYDFFFTLPKKIHPRNSAMTANDLKSLYSIFVSGTMLSQYTLSLQYTEFLIGIYKQSKKDKGTEREYRLISEILQYLEGISTSPLNTRGLSQSLGKNYHYLSTVFKRCTGFSISEYHQQLRIHKAAELLRDPHLNISEVSKIVGYSDPLYFSRVFKKVTGECPTDFLKGTY